MTTTTKQAAEAERLDPRPGAAVYTRRLLGFYDPFVLGFSNTYLWRCPTTHLLDWYNQHVSDRHLDVGVGTGYFLDRCRFPSPNPTVALVDLNVEALRFTEHRIARHHPISYRGSVLEPVKIPLAPFRSIGINYVLHCLPGQMGTKTRVFECLRPLLADDGVLFGATILGAPEPRSLLARGVMRFYNWRGIFGNRADTIEGLEAALAGSFRTVEISIRGSVARFAAKP